MPEPTDKPVRTPRVISTDLVHVRGTVAILDIPTPHAGRPAGRRRWQDLADRVIDLMKQQPGQSLQLELPVEYSGAIRTGLAEELRRQGWQIRTRGLPAESDPQTLLLHVWAHPRNPEPNGSAP